MKYAKLGKTDLTVSRVAYGGIVSAGFYGNVTYPSEWQDASNRYVAWAVDHGVNYFDVAPGYGNAQDQLGISLEPYRKQVSLACKTQRRDKVSAEKDLERSLKLLKTDYFDVYQLHCAPRCFAPGDESGLYECLLEAKKQGKIRHIGITAHLIQVALEAADSGLYETVQFPFSYLAAEQEVELVRRCAKNGVGFIAMKGLAGGLITRSDAAMAFIQTMPDVLPIWGIQRESELREWLSYFEKTPQMTDEIRAYSEKDREALAGEFCRGCGYCMPCPSEILINNCARMSLMLRRAPSKDWLNDFWQEQMKKIENCIECRRCVSRCPYSLDTPNLLKKNYEDYKKVLAGEVTV